MHAQSGFRRYFSNTSWMMLERVIRGVSVLVVSVYVARYLGPERFGILNYAISFVAIFAGIGALGLDSIVIRNIVQTPEDRDRILGTAFILKLAGSLASLILIVGGLQLTDSDMYEKIIVVIIGLGAAFKVMNVIDFFFQASVKGKNIAISQLYTVVISSSIQIGLVFLKAELIWFACAVAFENLLLSIFLLVMYKKEKYRILHWRWERMIAGGLIRDSWPLFLSALMTMLYMRIDQIMIKELINTEALGNYAIAVRFSEAFYIIPMAVTASLFPAIVNAKKTDERLYKDRLKKLFTLMFWVALFISVPMTLASDHIITLLFDNQYSGAGAVLKVHIWACAFVFLHVANSKYLLTENLVMVVFYQTVTGSILNIILNFVFIPRYGIVGAALATLITYVAIFAVLLFDQKARYSFGLLAACANPTNLWKR